MMKTTITISANTRDQIKEFRNKGETYNDILTRILNSAKERQLQELLMDEKDTLTIAEARAKLNRKQNGKSHNNRTPVQRYCKKIQ